MIRIVKASAGSGKTFSLTRQYISLLLKKKDDKFAYRHILAVTFTNKATEEMKSRILNELCILSKTPEQSDYIEDFVPALFDDAETLRQTARQILCRILHDYGSFSVSTIDRFFQQTLRAFSREIGQFASYQVELDRQSLLNETVDNVLDSLTGDDEQTLRWLTASALEQVEQGERYNLEKRLYEMAGRLKSEEHRVKIQESGVDEAKVYSRENLKEVMAFCNRYISAFEKSVHAAAREAVAIIERSGLAVNDFNRGFIKPVFEYDAAEPGRRLESLSTGFIDKALDHEKWFAKAKASRYLPMVWPALEVPLKTICDIFSEKNRIYQTLRIIKDQSYGLGLTGELYRSYNEILRDKNILSIDDTNLILRDIIAGSDAPFVYEKTGVRFENFLLDEFQDTSVIQWENLSPLLKESEANGNENFIVGDVKQSIYRWRGSDWNLLASGLQRELSDVMPENLDTNYRSLGNIVRFNNSFFREAARALDVKLGEKSLVDGIYGDVKQKCTPGKEEGGCVSVTFCEKDGELDKILAAVREAVDAGARPGDVAVLVRVNTDGAAVAEHLIRNNIKVITDDSLKVKSSITVNRLVSLMSAVDNTGDTVGSYLADSLDIDTSLQYQSIIELCEELIRGLKEYDSRQERQFFPSEIAYVQSFVDAVSDYANVHGNNLRGFLDWWKDADPRISSPNSSDSVRIITVHKAKGLAFPYVILPFVEKVTLFYNERRWCVPAPDKALPEAIRESVYDVNLSSDSKSTLFSADYEEELRRQYVDNINVLYVAMTRASKGMHIIAKNPPKKLETYSGGSWNDFSDFSQALFMFAVSGGGGLHPFDWTAGKGAGDAAEQHDSKQDESRSFRVGAMPDFTHKKGNSDAGLIDAGYPSWSINEPGRKPRLILSGEYSDFFSEEGEPGNTARMRGVVMHNILSAMKRKEDLDAAVEQAVTLGEISQEDAPAVKSFMEKRVASAVKRGWFRADATVYNEAGLIDTDGNVYRPDRVEVRPDGSVLVVDYKFARHKPEYLSQVARYADIWRRMGHSDVTACLWYVWDDNVIEE
ncbi:MAG: UvrD-helicase domain-containing protein [Bacteroidales bacterium]|nr:UvrD-helicase domain-containing protein [Bacteroidales bacterium]